MAEEKYAPVQEVSGMTEPQKPKSRKDFRVVLLLLAVGLAVVVVAVLYGLHSFGVLGRPKEQAQQVQTSEAQLKQLLEERRELESRIKTLEEERSNLHLNVAEMLDERIGPLQKQLEEVQALQDEIQNLRAEIASQAQTQEDGEEDEEEEIEPAEGSSGKTTLFSAVQEYTARLAEESKVDIPAPKYAKGKGVQTGRMIPGRLLTTLISSAALQDFYAVVETTESFSVASGAELPAGVRFLGKVLPDFESRRIIVKIEKMQYGDVEMPVSGIVLDERGNPGLVSKYVDPLNQAMWGSLIPNMLAAAADAAQDMVSYYDEDYDEERERPEFSEKNVALQGAADSLRLQAQILTEMQSRKKPVIIVNKDIPVLVQITERIPLEILLESGVIGE